VIACERCRANIVALRWSPWPCLNWQLSLGIDPFRLSGWSTRRDRYPKVGSGNVGATNVVRVLGKRYGYPVFALDVLKGFGAVKISMLIAPDGRQSGIRPRYLESSRDVERSRALVSAMA
jgi:hypothetical protein